MNAIALLTVNAPSTDTVTLHNIAVPASSGVSVEPQKTEWVAPVINSAYKAIASLVSEQETWLNGAHRTATEQLYSLLQRCYYLYKLMAADEAQNANLTQAIARHAKERNLELDEKSHTITKIIKVVFGADRRRASAYAAALRVALSEKIKVEELPNFFRVAGGIEEVRRKQANGGAAKVDKVAAATKHISNVTLAVIQEDAISAKLDCAAIKKQVVLLATQGVNGTLNINALVQGEGVTNAVLTAIYNAEHQNWAQQSSEQQVISEEEELDAIIAEATSETDLENAS
jgi:hypothetical protein